MKTTCYLLLFFGLSALTPVAGSPGLFAVRMPALFTDEENEDEEEPSEAVIRKLAAMMPDQTFKRGEKTTSKGGAAPEGTTVYPVKILNADGSLAFEANFFQEDGKWALFDNHGNVARMTE